MFSPFNMLAKSCVPFALWPNASVIFPYCVDGRNISTLVLRAERVPF